jgi:NADP-dependent 3-hydroxy acid dehydrogenase YdfG
MSVAIITGASSGIGAAVAVEFHRRGWKVGLIARRDDLLKEHVEAMGEGAAYATADVADEDGLTDAIRTLESELGPCDLMFANAGIGDGRSARNFTSANTLKIMNVNCAGVVHAFAAVLPGMLERGGGTLSATSSVAGFRGLPNFGPYSASKSYVTSLLESMRIDLRPHGVRVTTVHPGFVVSELTSRNAFDMPFLVQTDKAARIIVKGLLKGKSEVNFPWQMVCLMKFVRWVPNWLYDRVIAIAAPTTPKKEAE